MNDTGPPPLFLNENPAAVPLPKAVQQAYLWVVTLLGGAAAIALFVFAVATQSDADAQRISAGGSTLQVLTGALAVMHGRPGAL